MNVDKFFEVLQTYPSLKSVFSVYDVLINFGLPVILITPLAIVYKKTHKGVTYNQLFTHTLYIMTVTTSIIMMIIGSNIARAFSLVGALSIIRFRTAIKDSRDTGYIFTALAIGMASGTGMYTVAVTFTLCSIILILALHFFRVGEKVLSDKLLKLAISQDDHDDLTSLLKKNVQDLSLIHSEISEKGDKTQYTYIIRTDDEQKDQNLLKDINEISSSENVSLFYNDQRIEI